MKLFQLLLLLLLVFVHPKNPRSCLLDYVHLVISAIIRLLSSRLNALTHSALLSIGGDVYVLASFCEFVLETGVQAFVEVVVFGISAPGRALLSLVQHFTN